MSDTEELKPTAAEAGEEREVVFEEALEAMLFAAGHPLSYATIARVLEMTPGKVRFLTFDYAQKYNNSKMKRGVILLAFAENCQLCTKEKYLPEIRNALGIKKSGSLSTSSMEALAIVAYNQPVTRVFVDTLRRADSSYAMNNLLDRGLIESKGRLDVPGRPMLYGTTTDFLRCFGLTDISELPQTTEEIVNMFAKASNVPEEEGAEGETAEGTEAERTETDGKETTETADTPNTEREPEESADEDASLFAHDETDDVAEPATEGSHDTTTTDETPEKATAEETENDSQNGDDASVTETKDNLTPEKIPADENPPLPDDVTAPDTAKADTEESTPDNAG